MEAALISADDAPTWNAAPCTSLVTGTLKNLQQIAQVISDTARQVQEQAVVSDEIARNMDAVQKIAAEMVAGSEEAVLQGDQLHTLAFNLEQSVGGFNVDGSGGSSRSTHIEPAQQRPPARPQLKPPPQKRA